MPWGMSLLREDDLHKADGIFSSIMVVRLGYYGMSGASYSNTRHLLDQEQQPSYRLAVPDGVQSYKILTL